jgi:hypothetical protein
MVEAQQIAPETERLPEFLRPLFWDTDFSQLRIPDHEPYIIERILELGDDQAICWVWRTFGPEAIARTVRRSRVISPNTASLWALLLRIPRRRVRCFSRPFRITSEVF